MMRLRGGVDPVRAVTALAAIACAGACGRDAASVRALELRVAELAREVQEQQRALQAMREVLAQEGLWLTDEGLRADADAVTQGIERLLAATDRLENALLANDAPRAERASKAQLAAVASLAKAPGAAEHLLARAVAVPRPAQQARLVEAAAEIGGAALAPRLEELASAPATPIPVRQQAAKSLLSGAFAAGGERARGLALVARLLATEPEFPDLYYLVHLAGATRDPGALAMLCRALAHGSNPSIRCHAANALAHFPGAEAAAALAAAARSDVHESVRVNAVRALPRATRDVALVTAVAEDILRGRPSPQLQSAVTDALAHARAAPTGASRDAAGR